jgi:enediyne biosynthesis thioesterase
MRPYEYRHVVCFAETNVVGNVYFAHHVGWQGRCRELFLREHAPEVLAELDRGLALVTTRVSCDYYQEIGALDDILIRMYATLLTQNRVTMSFEYFRVTDGGEQLVARGEQQIACMRRQGGRMTAAPLPVALKEALECYMSEMGVPL